jgi:hypothetical protein
MFRILKQRKEVKKLVLNVWFGAHLQEIHCYCQKERIFCQWVNNGMCVDHQGQHTFQNILLSDASLRQRCLVDPELHHMAK